MLREKKGITLIALVITIIVLLILAGVSISAVMGENGIATKAKESATETEKAKAEEAFNLEISELQLDLNVGDEAEVNAAKQKIMSMLIGATLIEIDTETGDAVIEGYISEDGVNAEAVIPISMESGPIGINNVVVVDEVVEPEMAGVLLENFPDLMFSEDETLDVDGYTITKTVGEETTRFTIAESGSNT